MEEAITGELLEAYPPRESAELDKFLPAFIAAQGEFPSIKKSADNPHFKSKYADLGEIIPAVQPILAKNDLCRRHRLRVAESGKQYIECVIYHVSGQWISSGEIEIKTEANRSTSMQAQGSGITYGRRYTLLAVLDLATEGDDDDGNGAEGHGDKGKPAGGKGSGKQSSPPKDQGGDPKPEKTKEELAAERKAWVQKRLAALKGIGDPDAYAGVVNDKLKEACEKLRDTDRENFGLLATAINAAHVAAGMPGGYPITIVKDGE